MLDAGQTPSALVNSTLMATPTPPVCAKALASTTALPVATHMPVSNTPLNATAVSDFTLEALSTPTQPAIWAAQVVNQEKLAVDAITSPSFGMAVLAGLTSQWSMTIPTWDASRTVEATAL